MTRELGDDDDRLPGEAWEAYCRRVGRRAGPHREDPPAMQHHAILELPYGHQVAAVTDAAGARVYRDGAGRIVSTSPAEAVRRLGIEAVDREVAVRMAGDLIRARLAELERLADQVAQAAAPAALRVLQRKDAAT